MNRKMAMVLIAIIGIGLYALPQTVALFSGQHDFKNIDATGNQIDCVKCHGDVNAELTLAGVDAVTGTVSPHATFKCEYCHRIEAGYASGDSAVGVITYTGTDPTLGTVARKIAVNIMDMEAKNLPLEIDSNAAVAAIRLEPTVSGVAVGKLSASPCVSSLVAVPACDAVAVPLTIGAENGWKPVASYSSGAPKDTNDATKNTGLNIVAVTWAIDATDTRSLNKNAPVFLGAGSRAVNPGTSYHAASLVSCMECHEAEEPMGHYSRVVDGTDATSSCVKCHYGSSGDARMRTLWAGGFGLTTKAGDTGAEEAHTEFQTTDDLITKQKAGASNGACIACHTHVAVDITYTKPDTYKFDANFWSDGSESVGGFSAEGAAVSHSDG